MFKLIKAVTKLTFVSSMTVTGFTGGYVFYKSSRPDEDKLNITFDLNSLVYLETTNLLTSGKDIPSRNPNMMFDVEESNTTSGTFSVRYVGWNRPFVNSVIKVLTGFNNLYLHSNKSDRLTQSTISQIFPERNPFKETLTESDEKIIGPYYGKEYDFGMIKVFFTVMKWNLLGVQKKKV